MQSSKPENKTIGKVILAIVVFIAVACILSISVIFTYNHDFDGKYDCAFVGGSHTKFGISPEIIDNIMGTDSCNLAIANGPTLDARYACVESAIKHYPLETIVIDIAYDVPNRDDANWEKEYEVAAVTQLADPQIQWEYAKNHLSFMKGDYDLLLRSMLQSGYEVLKCHLLRTPSEFQATKGRLTMSVIRDVTLSDTQIREDYHSTNIMPGKYMDSNEAKIHDILRYCKDHGLRTVVIVTPLSEARLWSFTGWDSFSSQLKTIANEEGCEFYDFNLLKNREKLFSDATSFFDMNHLNDDGAEVFSEVLGRVLMASDDCSDLFYDTYLEAERHFQYAHD